MEGEAKLAVFTQLLGLKEFEVVAVEETPRECQWTVVWGGLSARCPHCGQLCNKRHECYERSIRDLPVMGRSLVLVVRQYQFECRKCGKYFTPPCDAFAPGTTVTERFLGHMVEVVGHSDLANTARLFGVPEKTLEGWYYDYVVRHLPVRPAHLGPVRCLGIDEISVKKRHRQFCIVLIDQDTGRVLDMLETREKAVLMRWLKEKTAEGVLRLEQVTQDMCEMYRDSVREALGPHVKITADRFHVVALFQQRLDEARREIQRTLPKEAAADLKGTRWLWLKNEENLSEDELHRRRALERKYPILGKLARQREALREIFENRHIPSARAAMKRLRRWAERAKEMGLRALDAFVGTLERWMEPIANYFINRATNGPTEGFNHGIRALLWRAYGMRNLAHLRARVLYTFGGVQH